MLEKVRGTSDVDYEFDELVGIVEASKQVPNSFKSLLFDPRYRPQLAVVIAMPIFQQWTGKIGTCTSNSTICSMPCMR